jgi:hypothetical protein
VHPSGGFGEGTGREAEHHTPAVSLASLDYGMIDRIIERPGRDAT